MKTTGEDIMMMMTMTMTIIIIIIIIMISTVIKGNHISFMVNADIIMISM